MDYQKRIYDAFLTLGKTLDAFLLKKSHPGNFDFTGRITERIRMAEKANPWFTNEFVVKSLKAWANALTQHNLKTWVAKYPEISETSLSKRKKVAVVMAGNIPLVGLHDFLCCLLTGHFVIAKLSSDDAVLLPLIGDILIDSYPELKHQMEFTCGQVKGFDAIIATGSDNTAKHFEYYFRKYPHIIRKNRNSIAVLDGKESFSNLDDLCYDIFDYFGMGCRSVSKIFVPKGYNFSNLTMLFDAFDRIGEHHKYKNNYDYQKSVLMINKIPFIDLRNLLLVKNSSLNSPLSVLHCEEYGSHYEIIDFINDNKDKLQCVVCNNAIIDNTTSFGKSQSPSLWDYADGIDTVKFLLSLNSKD